MTVTPVLADQLEDAGVRGAAAALPGRVADRRGRSRPAAGAGRVPRRLRGASCERYRHALELLDAAGGDPLRAFQRGGGGGTGRARRLLGDPRGAAAAGDPRRGCGCSSTPASARTGAASAGTAASGCPSAPTCRGSSGGWPSTGCAGSASTRAPTREPLDGAGARSRPRPARWRCRSTGRRSRWLWSLDGYPSDPAHAQFAGKSLRGIRIWKVGGGAYDPAAAAAAARRQAGEFLAAAAARLRALRRRAAAAAACSSSRSTPSCSATGGRRGRSGCAEVLERRRGGRGAAAAPCRRRWPSTSRSSGRSRASTWGEGKDLRTWDSPRGRRPRLGARGGSSCACCGRSRGGPARRGRRSAPRASCSPSRRATGPSSTARAGRRLRLPARHRARRGGCSRP